MAEQAKAPSKPQPTTTTVDTREQARDALQMSMDRRG